MNCPKCDFEQAQTTECLSCGIVFSKWEARQEQIRAEEERPALPEASGQVKERIPPPPFLNGRPKLTVLRDSYVSIAKVIRAGIPLSDAIVDLSRGARGRWGRCLNEIAEDLREGEPLSSAMRAQGHIFRPEEVQLVLGSERLGTTADALEAMAIGVQTRIEARRQVLRSISYPIFLVLLTVLMMPIPELFKGGSGDYFGEVIDQLAIVFVIIALVVFVIPWLFQFPGLRNRLKKMAWSIPWPGTLYVHHVRGLFSQVLSANLNSGIPLYESLTTAHQVCQDPVLTERTEKLLKVVQEGEPLSPSMASLNILDSSDHILLIAGERSGTLPESLDQVAVRHGELVQRGTKTLIQAVTILITFLSVLFIAMEIVKSYQNLNSGAEEILNQIERHSPIKNLKDLDLNKLNLEDLKLMDLENPIKNGPFKNISP